MKLLELVSDEDLITSAAAIIANAKAKDLGRGALCPEADSKFPLFLSMMEGMHPAAAAGARVAILAIDTGLRKKFGIDESKPKDDSNGDPEKPTV